MSTHERAGEDRRSLAGGAESERIEDRRDTALRREAASGRPASGRGPHGDRPGVGESRPLHAQLVFVTPLGVPIGPSVQEELNIPDDLDDSLPPGDFPGQLLLDLGLG